MDIQDNKSLRTQCVFSSVCYDIQVTTQVVAAAAAAVAGHE